MANLLTDKLTVIEGIRKTFENGITFEEVECETECEDYCRWMDEFLMETKNIIESEDIFLVPPTPARKRVGRKKRTAPRSTRVTRSSALPKIEMVAEDVEKNECSSRSSTFPRNESVADVDMNDSSTRKRRAVPTKVTSSNIDSQQSKLVNENLSALETNGEQLSTSLDAVNEETCLKSAEVSACTKITENSPKNKRKTGSSARSPQNVTIESDSETQISPIRPVELDTSRSTKRKKYSGDDDPEIEPVKKQQIGDPNHDSPVVKKTPQKNQLNNVVESSTRIRIQPPVLNSTMIYQKSTESDDEHTSNRFITPDLQPRYKSFLNESRTQNSGLRARIVKPVIGKTSMTPQKLQERANAQKAAEIERKNRLREEKLQKQVEERYKRAQELKRKNEAKHLAVLRKKDALQKQIQESRLQALQKSSTTPESKSKLSASQLEVIKKRDKKIAEIDAKRKQDEEERLKKQLQLQEEQHRLEQEKKQEEDKKRREMERKAEEERKRAEAVKKEQEEKKRQLDEKKHLEEMHRLDEKLKLEAERRKEEELRRKEAERRKNEAELKREEERRRDELRKLREEEQRREAMRQREEERRREEQRQREEAKKIRQKENEVQYQMTPLNKSRFAPKIYDDYGIEDLQSDESTDDESQPKKVIPKWARDIPLKTALVNQHYYPGDIDAIFDGLLSPCDLEAIFTHKKKQRFYKRTSSACWPTPMLKPSGKPISP